MTLLDHYLKSVRLYLPKNTAQDDIVAELSELLQSTMDEEEEKLGRPLTEVEQQGILTKHGNPIDVANRYGVKNRSVSFGWQLIGPELFPLYARILMFNLVLTSVVFVALSQLMAGWSFKWVNLLLPLVVQFTILTSIFTCIDYFQRRAKGSRSWLREDTHWQFPPAYLQRVPRWQSLAGGCVLLGTLVWWTLLPFAPQVLLLSAAETMEFSSSVGWVYRPVLLVLLVGVVQRGVVLAYPDLNWLQSATRLVVNLALVALVYPFALSYPFIVAKDALNPEVAAAALRINRTLYSFVVLSFSFYWLINAGLHVWLCAQHLRRAQRRRAEHSAS